MEPAPVQERPRSELRPPGRGPWVSVSLVIAAAIAVAFAVWYRNRPPPPIGPVVVEPAPASGQPGTAAAPATAPPGQARPLLESASPNPLYRRGLEDDGVRRWAVVTDNIGEGVSPRRQLAFLAPSRPFSVGALQGRTVIASESYQRYDAFADAVASVDVGALMKAYRALHGVLETAYRGLGYPGASLDRVSERALRRIVAAPVVDGGVEVEKKEGAFVFTDPKLESLDAVQKHLLRMGPRNTRAIQAKAKEILAQLAPATADPAASRR